MYQPFPTLLKPHVLSREHGHWASSHWPDAEMKARSFLAKSLFLALKHIIFIQPTTWEVISKLSTPSFL